MTLFFNLYIIVTLRNFFKEIEFSMNNVRRKHSMYRILKTISYLAGFPLFIAMVVIGSMEFMSGAAFGETKWNGVYVAFLIWAIITVLQIVFSLFCKNYKGRTMFAIILVIVFMTGGAFAFDIYAKGVIEDVAEEYKNTGVTVKDFTYQVNWYVPFSDKGGMASSLKSKLDNFTSTYNIGYGGSGYGSNADGTESKDNENGAPINPNGLYKDGYVFSTPEAMDILITYYTVQDKFKKAGKDADKELEKAIEKLQSNSSSEWNKYKRTSEYTDAYGKNGEAYKYMLSLERLEVIIGKLGGTLSSAKNADGMYVLKGLLEMKIPFTTTTVADLITGFLKDKDGNVLLTAEELASLITASLSIDDILPIINALDLFDGMVLTEDNIMDLLSDFIYYQMPTIKPVFYFIDDADLKAYAYAKYAGQVHGAVVGSVLIPNSSGRIGQVTFEANGKPASEAFSLGQIYQLKADLEYQPKLFPLFAARRYMYIFSAIVCLGLILAYHFGNKEKKLFKEIYEGTGR